MKKSLAILGAFEYLKTMKTEMNRYMNRSEIIDRLCDYNDGDTKYTPHLPYKRVYRADPAVQKLIDDHEASLPAWMRYEW